MPSTRIVHYLGTQYRITTEHDYLGGTLWRNVIITRGGIAIGPASSEIDLGQLWGEFTSKTYYARKREFMVYLKSMVTDPDNMDFIFCGNCDHPTWEDETRSGVCDPCYDEYFRYCDTCDEDRRRDEFTETLNGNDVCGRCRNNYYSYCEECDGYYPDGEADDHEHPAQYDGCCESPQLVFAIRNDGEEPLGNDTRAEFTLPAGTISQAGMGALSQYLRTAGLYDLSYRLPDIGDQWQTREGNFAKRLSRYGFKTLGAKITPEVMSQVGCIARDHSNAVSVRVEITRDLNQGPEYFYHDDSCWWGGYGESRCALKTNGGFALRSFDEYDGVSGRAFVMPLRLNERDRLVATFTTLEADAFVTFNGYGDLSGYAAARILAHMAGWTYRKIGFDCDPMYINAGGFLVAPEHIAAQYTDGALNLSVNQHSDLFEWENKS